MACWYADPRYSGEGRKHGIDRGAIIQTAAAKQLVESCLLGGERGGRGEQTDLLADPHLHPHVLQVQYMAL